jgi:branched-chain amino acid transport system ATP-binding protein
MAEKGKEVDKAILELRDIYKDFNGLKVLFGINLKIEEGERHAIIGPNGAGKSTIYNLITGKYLPSHGKIFFKGKDVTGESPFKLNRMGLSRSFQITNIFRTMTVFQNIQNAVLSRNKIRYNMFSLLSNMNGIIEETERIISEIGLLEQKHILAGELPHGHQRALEIGLTLATDPEVILLDEPSAGMTTEETRETVKLIERITEGKTLVIVEHDMEVVFSLARRITVLYYGKVLASGASEEIRQDQRVKDAYLGEEKE